MIKQKVCIKLCQSTCSNWLLFVYRLCFFCHCSCLILQLRGNWTYLSFISNWWNNFQAQNEHVTDMGWHHTPIGCQILITFYLAIFSLKMGNNWMTDEDKEKKKLCHKYILFRKLKKNIEENVTVILHYWGGMQIDTLLNKIICVYCCVKIYIYLSSTFRLKQKSHFSQPTTSLTAW